MRIRNFGLFLLFLFGSMQTAFGDGGLSFSGKDDDAIFTWNDKAYPLGVTDSGLIYYIDGDGAWMEPPLSIVQRLFERRSEQRRADSKKFDAEYPARAVFLKNSRYSGLFSSGTSQSKLVIEGDKIFQDGPLGKELVRTLADGRLILVSEKALQKQDVIRSPDPAVMMELLGKYQNSESGRANSKVQLILNNPLNYPDNLNQYYNEIYSVDEIKNNREMAAQSAEHAREIDLLASRRLILKTNQAYDIPIQQGEILFGKNALGEAFPQKGKLAPDCHALSRRGWCCFRFANEHANKFMSMPPFEEEVKLTRSKDKSRVLIEPKSHPPKWSIHCVSDSDVVETLAFGGAELKLMPAKPFFKPEKPDPAREPHLVARPELFEHLPAKTQLRFTKDFFLGPIPTQPSQRATFPLGGRGPVECQVQTAGGLVVHKIPKGMVLELEKSSVRLDTYAPQNIWRWSVKNIGQGVTAKPGEPAEPGQTEETQGIFALECRKPKHQGALAIRDAHTAMSGFAQIVSADGNKYPVRDADEGSAAEQKKWKNRWVYYQDYKPGEIPLDRFLKGTEIKLKDGYLPLAAGETRVTLTKSDDLQCWFDLPVDLEKARSIRDLVLVSSAADFLGGHTHLEMEAGDQKVKVLCKNNTKIPTTMARFISFLDPKFEAKIPEPTVFGEPVKIAKGSMKVERRFRDCKGKISGVYDFVFKATVLPANETKLDLKNGCIASFFAEPVDRTIEAGESIRMKGWKYKRTVPLKETSSNYAQFEADALEIEPPHTLQVHCDFKSDFATDEDEKLVCEDEFVKTLSARNGGDSVVDFQVVKAGERDPKVSARGQRRVLFPAHR